MAVALVLMIYFQSTLASIIPDFFYYAFGAYLPLLFFAIGLYQLIVSIIKKRRITWPIILLIFVNALILASFVAYVQSRLIVAG